MPDDKESILFGFPFLPHHWDRCTNVDINMATERHKVKLVKNKNKNSKLQSNKRASCGYQCMNDQQQ